MPEICIKKASKINDLRDYGGFNLICCKNTTLFWREMTRFVLFLFYFATSKIMFRWFVPIRYASLPEF